MKDIFLIPVVKALYFLLITTISLSAHAKNEISHVNQDNMSTIVSSKFSEAITPEKAIHAKDGHFYTVGLDLKPGTADDKRIRFWGINLSPPMTFPETNEDAKRLVIRLKKLGFNLVRLHAIDMLPKKLYLSIFEDSNESYPVLNTKNLESLKMLVRLLKQHGIYVDLTLKLGYTFDSNKDCILIKEVNKCVPDSDLLTEKYTDAIKMPAYSKPLDLFNKEMIALQKTYFKKILKYFKNDPVLAMVEIANENSLIEIFLENNKRLPPVYAKELDVLWEQWLFNKYENIDNLNVAWYQKDIPGRRENMLINGFFNKTRGNLPADWKLTQWPLDGFAKWGGWKVTEDHELNVNVNHIPHKYWYMFITQAGHQVVEGDSYSVTIRAKSNPPRKIQISVNVEDNGKSIQANRYKQVIQLDREYRDYRICFKSIISSINARLTILPVLADSNPGELWIDRIKFTSANYAIDANISKFEKASRPVQGLVNTCPESRKKELDYIQFLVDIETRYYSDMKTYLKDELQISIPISGVQANYGGLLGNKIMNDEMDYIDVHYYWDHPNINRNNPQQWHMKNISMVDHLDKSILNTIASNRNLGKPFTISEYGMNLANEYAQEGFVLGAAFGAYQDIDAIMVFDYNAGGSGTDSRKRMQPNQLTGWYNILGDTRSEILLPVAADIFKNTNLSGDIKSITIAVNEKMRRAALLSGASIRDNFNSLSEIERRAKKTSIFSKGLYLNNKISLLHTENLSKHNKELKAENTAKSNDDEQIIDINYLADNQRAIMISTPTTSIMIGDMKESIKFSGLQIIGASGADQFCTVSVSSLDNKPINKSNNFLIRAIGKGKNENTDIIKVNNGYRSCVVGNNGKCSNPFFHPEAGAFSKSSCNLVLSYKNLEKNILVETLDYNGNVLSVNPLSMNNGTEKSGKGAKNLTGVMNIIRLH